MFFKSKIKELSEFPNNIIAFFKNGCLYKITPKKRIQLYEDRGRANIARYIVSDGIKYDLSSVDDIDSIPIPKYYTESKIGVTGMLEYVLKMHQTDNINLEIALMDKAIDLMDYSYFDYPIDTYLQLPQLLYKNGLFELGDKKLSKILASNKYTYDFNPIKLQHYRDYYFKKYSDPNSVPKSFSAYMRKINKKGDL